MNYTYDVKVIDKSTGDCVNRLEAIGLHKARKLKSGIEINLNKNNYFVTITKQD